MKAGMRMKMYKSKTWQHVKTGVDGNCELFGVNIFNYHWESTGEHADVRDTSYGQDHKFSVFRVNVEGEIHTFAAGEFSNCVWGFYLYQY